MKLWDDPETLWIKASKDGMIQIGTSKGIELMYIDQNSGTKK